jgi:hypothetical protein
MFFLVFRVFALVKINVDTLKIAAAIVVVVVVVVLRFSRFLLYGVTRVVGRCSRGPVTSGSQYAFTGLSYSFSRIVSCSVIVGRIYSKVGLHIYFCPMFHSEL